MADNISIQYNIKSKPTVERALRSVMADAYTFVRSSEANNAFATVTLEELMGDQIKRNGESETSRSYTYNPYSYDPSVTQAKGVQPQNNTNFLGGTDTGGPTKLDRVLAIKNALVGAITAIKSLPVVEVSDSNDYARNVRKNPDIG
jgi:hypothetical protein